MRPQLPDRPLGADAPINNDNHRQLVRLKSRGGIWHEDGIPDIENRRHGNQARSAQHEAASGLENNRCEAGTGRRTLELALPGNIPFRPMIYLSNPSVQGAVVSLRISGPLGFGLPDIALSLIMPTLPSGVDYLGCGLILVDLIQVCQGAFRSIDLNGVSIEPDHISLDVACAEFDLESLPRAASLLQAISIEEL